MKYSLDRYQVYEVATDHLTLWFPETDMYVRITIPGVGGLSREQVAGQIRDAVRDMLRSPMVLAGGGTLCADDYGLGVRL